MSKLLDYRAEHGEKRRSSRGLDLAWRALGLLDRPALRAAAFAIAILSVTLTGILGFGRPNAGLLGGGEDFEYLYAAGRIWLEGMSPYDHGVLVAELERAKHSAFAYPPVIFPVCVALGALPHDAAELLWQAVNLACAALIAMWSVNLANPAPEHRSRLLTLTLVLVFLLPFTSHVLWMGQTSLFATALIVGAFEFRRRGHFVAVGVLGALAVMKPQLSLLPMAWIALSSRAEWRRWVPAGLAVGLASVAVPLGISGLSRFVADYSESMSLYNAAPYARPEWPHMVGLESLAHAVGFSLPTLLPLGLVILAVAWSRRDRFANDTEVLSFLMVASILFLFAHNYDLVALFPLIPMVYVLALDRPQALGWAAFGLVILNFPQRVLAPFGIPVLIRYRELLLCGLFAWFCVRLFSTARQSIREPRVALEFPKP